MNTATRKPRAFISRTTAGLKGLAEQVAEILRERGIEPIIQTKCRMKNQPTRHSTFPIRHFPAALGTLFKGRDDFLAELRQHLTAEGPVVIKGKRTIHGMGGVGTTMRLLSIAQSIAPRNAFSFCQQGLRDFADYSIQLAVAKGEPWPSRFVRSVLSGACVSRTHASGSITMPSSVSVHRRR